MSLDIKLQSIAFQQYLYKLKAYTYWIFALILLQLLGLMFSLSGIQYMSAGSAILNVSIKYYSADVVIVFSFVWIFFITTRIASKPYKTMDFTLVTNRVSSHLSNIGILVTAAIFSGMTSSLMTYVLKAIMYFTLDRSQIGTNGFYPVLSDLLLGIAMTSLYMILISATSFFIGILVQIHVLFAVLFPAILLGMAKVNPQLLKLIFDYFASETSPSVFMLKVVFWSLLLFFFSCLISNKMEVRK
jgi:hypothetical protein